METWRVGRTLSGALFSAGSLPGSPLLRFRPVGRCSPTVPDGPLVLRTTPCPRGPTGAPAALQAPLCPEDARGPGLRAGPGPTGGAQVLAPQALTRAVPGAEAGSPPPEQRLKGEEEAPSEPCAPNHERRPPGRGAARSPPALRPPPPRPPRSWPGTSVQMLRGCRAPVPPSYLSPGAQPPAPVPAHAGAKAGRSLPTHGWFLPRPSTPRQPPTPSLDWWVGTSLWKGPFGDQDLHRLEWTPCWGCSSSNQPFLGRHPPWRNHPVPKFFCSRPPSQGPLHTTPLRIRPPPSPLLQPGPQTLRSSHLTSS
ncbi:PREDICTED: proline-rich protein 2-like [Elephantulus edwardii]|uniref:proline-rich protein 2-like n=1 Tax=Elephantulus edwardii TaxID=28737 RepID=UPI0003F0B40A|nr:PREDICTED: proline-rich protein 2-like [Elephantulus edwardii]